MFFFSAWSKQVCYELTVEFNCNSMSTIIVNCIQIRRVDQKKSVGFETVDDKYQKLHSSLVLEINNCILDFCIKNIVQ